MPSTYSPDLRIELIGNGEQTGIWGSTTNTNLGTLLEQSITGITDVTITNANQALIAYNGVEDEARSAVLVLATSLTTNFNVYIPPSPKSYIVRNTSNLYTATIYASNSLGSTTAAGAGVTIPTGVSVLIRTDGIDVFEQLNQIVGTLNVGGTLTAQANQVVGGSTSIAGSAYLGVSQAATITVATPAVITVAASPLNDTAVRFTTTNLLPAPLDTTTTYYVKSRTATTFQVSTSIGGASINTTAFGSGTHTVTTVSLATTAPSGTNNTQLATTGFVAAAIGGVPITLTNWSFSETTATQAISSMTVASPTVITVATSPANGTAVSFSTGSGGVLPTGVTADAPYYVYNRTGTTYNLSTNTGTSLTATMNAGATATLSSIAGNTLTVTGTVTGLLSVGQVITGGTISANTSITALGTGVGGIGTYTVNNSQTVASTTITAVSTPGVVTVTTAPSNGNIVSFSTTGTLPTGIVAGTSYYVINRTSTTFQISATSGGTAINFSGTQTGTHTATWFALVNTTGTSTLPLTETTSKLYFKYKNQNRMSIDLGGNTIASGNVTAFGTP